VFEASSEKIFGAIEQAVADLDIKQALREGCLVKFPATHPPTIAEAIGQLGGGASQTIATDWTILCHTLPDGRTAVSIHVTIQLYGPGHSPTDVMTFRDNNPDKKFAVNTAKKIFDTLHTQFQPSLSPSAVVPR
jgi:hypothetical protein